MSDDKLPSWMVEDSPSPSPAPTAVSTPSHSPAPVPALNYSNPSPPKAAPADDTPDWMKTESDAPSNPTSTDLNQKQHQRPSPQQDQQSQFLEEGNRRDYQHSETPPDWMMSGKIRCSVQWCAWWTFMCNMRCLLGGGWVRIIVLC